jgi:hypothetical protein
MRQIVISLVMLAGTLCAQPASDRDFTGKWRLNESRSDSHALPWAPFERFTIEHAGREIRTSVVLKAGDAPVLLHYTTDGKECRNKMGETSLNSMLRWEGTALLMHTIISDRSASHTEMDRWRLSRDGKLLTIRRQIERARGEIEPVLVYERE